MCTPALLAQACSPISGAQKSLCYGWADLTRFRFENLNCTTEIESLVIGPDWSQSQSQLQAHSQSQSQSQSWQSELGTTLRYHKESLFANEKREPELGTSIENLI